MLCEDLEGKWGIDGRKVQEGGETIILIARKSINNLRYADDSTIMAESEEELRSLLMNVKEENEKAGLKLNFPKQRSQDLAPSLHGK